MVKAWLEREVEKLDSRISQETDPIVRNWLCKEMQLMLSRLLKKIK